MEAEISVCCRCLMVWWLLAMRKKLSKSFPKRRMVLTVSCRFVPLLQSGMELETQTLWTRDDAAASVLGKQYVVKSVPGYLPSSCSDC